MDVSQERITLVDENIESWISQSIDPEEEIKARTEIAKRAFLNLKPLLCANELNLAFNCGKGLPSAMYGLFCCTLSRRGRIIKKGINAFNMWLFEIPWTSQTIKENLLIRIGHDRGLLTIIKRRKLKYLRHVMRYFE